MNEPNDAQLDQWLYKADEALQLDPSNSVSFSEIERQALRNRNARTMRWRSFSGLALLGLLLCGWIWLTPANDSEQSPLSLLEKETIELNILQNELVELRARRTRIDEQLAMLKLEQRVDKLQLQVKHSNTELSSPELSYLRNRDSRVALEQIIDDRMEKLTANDIKKLQLLIAGYPNTKAGKEAQALVAKLNNQL